MTVRIEGGGDTQRFMGTSTDDKPIDNTVQDGATFHIIDTGEVYVFCDGMWETDLRNDPTLRGL